MSKKIIAILFCIIIVNASTEIHQLIKFPFLLKHYSQHQKEDPSLSFIAFLKIHYSGIGHDNDNDDKEDSQLPFKSIGNISHLDTPVIEKQIIIGENNYLLRKPVTYYSAGITGRRSFSIFHPPRYS